MEGGDSLGVWVAITVGLDGVEGALGGFEGWVAQPFVDEDGCTDEVCRVGGNGGEAAEGDVACGGNQHVGDTSTRMNKEREEEVEDEPAEEGGLVRVECRKCLVTNLQEYCQQY